MRALVYTRVSQDRAHGRSVEEQEAESRRLCADRGWTVAEVVTDSRGASRHSKGSRSGWQRVAKLLEAGGVDVLVTWEASRAQRDIAAYAELRDLCVTTGTLWCYSGRVHDLSTADDRFRTGIDALLAEREADETAERVQRAVRANAVAGRPHGRRLFGYQRVYDPTTGQLVDQIPDPAEAAVVRRIFTEYLDGTGLPKIAQRLNEDGITTGTGSTWNPSQIRRVLVNPAYIGQRVHRGEVIGPATWEGLVPAKDQQRALALLSQRRTNPGQTSWRARLLTGVLRCGVCGSRNVWSGHDRNHRKVYACRDGHHVARDETKLDAHVSRLIVEYLERPDVIADRRASPVHDPEVEAQQTRIADARAKLDDAVSEFTAGRLTAGTLARIEHQLLTEIADAEARIRRTVIPLDFDIPATGVAQWWEKLSPERQRLVVGALIEQVVLHPAKRGSRTFDPTAVDVEFR